MASVCAMTLGSISAPANCLPMPPGIISASWLRSPMPLQLHELFIVVGEGEAVLLELFLELLRLLLVDVLLRLFDEAEHIAHAQDAGGHAVGVEGLEHRRAFRPCPTNLMGLPVDRADGERRAAAGIAVELGEHDAVDAERLVERGGGVHRVLSGHGVHDQQDLVRLHRRLDALAARPSAASSMCRRPAVSRKTMSLPWSLACLTASSAMVDRGRSAPSRTRAGRAVRRRPASCVDGRGTVDVAGDEQRALALLAQKAGKLGRRWWFCPRPEGRPSSRPSAGCWQKVKRAFAPPIRAVSSSLTILMTCWAGVRLSSTSAPTARSVTSGDKVLDDLVAHVRLEQRHAHLAHRDLDVRPRSGGPCRAGP